MEKKMKNALALIMISLLVSVSHAEPSNNHISLKGAAEWAVLNSNVELLRALLQAGVQIDEPVVDGDINWTMLHCAVLHNKPRVVQFLLDNGATLDIRSKGGDRPIDMAFDESCTNVCRLLEKPTEKEELIGDIPEAVLEEILRLKYSEEPTFVSFNGTNAPAVLVEWLVRSWKDVRPTSQAELTEGTEGKTGHIQDKETHDSGRRFDIEIKKTADGYDWAVTSYHGPLSAWGQSGKLIKKYGYWLRVEVRGWQS
jgi:hypothetical protein